jgi:hypothetical protein
LPACVKALQISINDFDNLRREPSFKSLIDIECEQFAPYIEAASTRHAELSRRITNSLVPNISDQVDLICKVLELCDKQYIDFVRNLMTKLCTHYASYNLEQMKRIKKSTEKYLKNDVVLNHQFGAFLIRERTDYSNARYYLDIALNEEPDNDSIIHSLGNLNFNLYKDELGNNNNLAEEYFNSARKYFRRSRSRCNLSEHSYYTDISLLNFKIENGTNRTKLDEALLVAEKNALTFEALKVIPRNRQNYLRDIVGSATPFHRLEHKNQTIIEKEILKGEASPFLIEYYAHSLIGRKARSNWDKLNTLVEAYWERSNSDPQIAIIIALICKQAFIKNAESRFELLRGYFDSLVRYKEKEINFSLLAEFVRMIQIDGFVLKKYDFLQSIAGDIINTFRQSKPRFLVDEYILDDLYYTFDQDNIVNQWKLFKSDVDFNKDINAMRFSTLVNLNGLRDQRYFKIRIYPFSSFYIRGITKEVSTVGKVDISYNVKHTHEGLIATKIKV